MNTTPKTNECIKMLGEAQLVFSPLYYSHTGRFDKNMLLDYQGRIKAMLDYRLMPFGVISMPDNADKETARANPILQNINDFDAFWYAMKNYQLVTGDDLKNEFWSICPDLESIPKYLDVMNVKFDAVNYDYDTDIDEIKEQYNGLDKLVAAGKITEQEADEMLWNLHFIADRYNFIIYCIREIYKEFRKMTECPNRQMTKEPISDEAIHFNSKETKENLKTVFERLKKNGYLHSDNDLNTWLYVCGTIKSNEQVQPLKWTKDQELLAHLINEMFGDSDGTRLWVITKRAFLIKGKMPNTDTMKNTVSRIKNNWKDKPKKFDDLSSLLII